ncbi:MAG: hypothetical protein GXO90_09795, partial [FCB group bacterium]|nr:hypothetical protein [FCB group bacterium]
MIKKAPITLFFLITILRSQAYDSSHILVQLAPDVKISNYSQILDKSQYTVEKVVVRRLKILLVKVVNPQKNVLSALAEFKASPWIKNAQLDHEVRERSTYPDDPSFGSLWGLENTGQSGGTVDAD